VFKQKKANLTAKLEVRESKKARKEDQFAAEKALKTISSWRFCLLS